MTIEVRQKETFHIHANPHPFSMNTSRNFGIPSPWKIPKSKYNLNTFKLQCVLLTFYDKARSGLRDIKSCTHGTAEHYSKFYDISQTKVWRVVTCMRHQRGGGVRLYKSLPHPTTSNKLPLNSRFLITRNTYPW